MGTLPLLNNCFSNHGLPKDNDTHSVKKPKVRQQYLSFDNWGLRSSCKYLGQPLIYQLLWLAVSKSSLPEKVTFPAAITKIYHQKGEEFKTITGREVTQKEITDSESSINTVLKDLMTLNIVDCKIRQSI